MIGADAVYTLSRRPAERDPGTLSGSPAEPGRHADNRYA